MHMGLYQKIISDGAAIPQISLVTLTGLGETLLDSLLLERVRYARRLCPDKKIDIFTNGTYLTIPLILDLKDAGVNVIHVSLNGVNSKQRHDQMGLKDYDHVVSVLQQLPKYLNKMTEDFHVYVKGIIATDLMKREDTLLFGTQWGPLAYVSTETNWAGTTRQHRVPANECCCRAIGQFMVLVDGRVAMCCADANGQVIFGDMKSQTIREVYNSPEYVKFREVHNENRRDELPICAYCSTT